MLDMIKSSFIYVIFLACSNHCQSLLVVKGEEQCVNYSGRYNLTDDIVSFDSPGFQLSINVEGASDMDVLLSIAGNNQPHRFWIYVNDILNEANIIDTSNMTVNEVTKFKVASNLEAGSNEINIVKITEADWNNIDPTVNYVSFHGFILDSGNAVCPAPAAPTRKIEFIGDSITAGYCNMCESLPDVPGYAQESFVASWPFLVSASLNAAYHVSAWSGFGMVRNCCGGDTHMPEIFSRTLASVAGENTEWSFSSWTPDVVVINLGTNDHLNESDPGDVEMHYQEVYIEFVRNISKWYISANGGKGVSVFLACGPMSEAYCPYVFNIIDELTRGSAAESPVATFFLDQRNVLNSTNQCCGHPDSVADQTLADMSAPVIAETMGWTL